MGHRKLLFARLLVFWVCSWMNSRIAQKITCTAAIPDKKVICVFCVSEGIVLPTICCSNEIPIFFSLTLFSPGIHNAREKSWSTIIVKLSRSSKMSLPFLLSGIFETYMHFVENLEMTHKFCQNEAWLLITKMVCTSYLTSCQTT